MPLVRLDLPTRTTPETMRAVADGVHNALVSALEIPVADRFQTLTRRDPGEIICTEEFLGVTHTDQVVFVQITLAPRSMALKKALFLEIAEGIARETHFKANDVVINLIETARENWSFGNGAAQFAPTEQPSA
jgi:phenylpyruvate tautomerase PptA (4-oxalocrotonate tautomerase family)